jgi:pSer/pThr/pTyr-binding forkhead associated (FHA) protein
MPTPNRNDPAECYEGPEGTLLESVDELRRQIQSPQRQATVREPTAAAAPFRPVRRPPMALLTVLDDGRDEGEVLRVRGNSFVIGRAAGDLVIPHDTMMSGRHAEISRVNDKGRWRWLLTDLQSTNGTYVRVASGILKHEQEFLLGGRRYRFDAAPQGADAPKPGADPGAQKTHGWQAVAPTDVLPSFVELTPQGPGQRYFLDRAEHWLGQDPHQCSVVLAGDPMVSPRHARLYRDAKQRWVLENAASVNGIWMRVNRIPIEGTGHFQLGEQRFVLKVL